MNTHIDSIEKVYEQNVREKKGANKINSCIGLSNRKFLYINIRTVLEPMEMVLELYIKIRTYKCRKISKIFRRKVLVNI